MMSSSSTLDGAMGPPSSNGHVISGQTTLQPKQDAVERYRTLKRRFQELEDESAQDGDKSNERNVRRRQEQDNIRNELKGLEERAGSIAPGYVDGPQARENIRTGESEANPKSSTITTSPRSRAVGQANATMTAASRRTELDLTDGLGQTHNYPLASPKTPTAKKSPTRPPQGVIIRRSQRNAAGSGSAIAAVAAAAAEAEAAAAALDAQTQGRDVIMTHAVTSQDDTGVSPSVPSAATSTSNPSSSANAELSAAYANFAQSPAMESIVKVAEAAIAAQNAARSAAAGQNTDVDPNLDPSLFSGSENHRLAPPAAQTNAPNSINTLPAVDTTTSDGNSTASASTTPPSSATSTSSNLSNNPYLALATNLLPRANPGSTTTTGHPMFMPYPFFYPSAGSPVTPGTTPYAMPYNPYYFLAAPMVPGPNGMYAPPPGFAPPPPPQSHPPPQIQSQQGPPADPQKPGKPKRLKAHTVTTKSFSIPVVPRDKKNKPMLPLNVGIMTVISLGDVCMREHFHTERYIFPVGYEVTRRYLSTTDPSIEVVYHCTILDGGDGPKFQIIPADRPDKPVIAGTATGAWSNIVKQANAIRNRQHSNSVSGPDFFGLGQNTIKHLIQELPNADKLRDYVWQNFVEGGPLGGRHAAVIPALPEEYDASLPLGAYYPHKSENANSNLPRGISYYPQHIIAQAEAQKAQKAAVVQQANGQGIPGPSGPASGPVLAGPSGSQQPHMIGQQTIADDGGLTIKEYQQPQTISTPPSDTPSQKRATRASTANTNATNTRHTRSVSRGNQLQQTQQPSGPAPTVDADGPTPMTFAGIMSAFPVPNSAPTPVIAQNTTGAASSS